MKQLWLKTMTAALTLTSMYTYQPAAPRSGRAWAGIGAHTIRRLCVGGWQAVHTDLCKSVRIVKAKAFLHSVQSLVCFLYAPRVWEKLHFDFSVCSSHVVVLTIKPTLIPGDVPGVSQRPPQLVLLWADSLTEQQQGRVCQEGREYGGGQVCRVLSRYLWGRTRAPRGGEWWMSTPGKNNSPWTHWQDNTVTVQRAHQG